MVNKLVQYFQAKFSTALQYAKTCVQNKKIETIKTYTLKYIAPAGIYINNYRSVAP